MPGRKPRIALMGEFSAGKSTLSNLLIGARPLPEKVTATRLSPVWMSYGTEEPYAESLEGERTPVSLDRLEAIPVETTRVIRLFLEANILELADLIDFPGISDPNMASEVWERVLPEVDAVIWCTHATQAWRQSEAAVWDMMPELVREHSILLITRFDKLTTDTDRRRVFKRVMRETEGAFRGTFPISLLQALEAGDDAEAWEGSGAGPLVATLIALIEELAELADAQRETLHQIGTREALEARSAPKAPPKPVRPIRVAEPGGVTPARAARPVGRAERDDRPERPERPDRPDRPRRPRPGGEE